MHPLLVALPLQSVVYFLEGFYPFQQLHMQVVLLTFEPWLRAQYFFAGL
jgi:hypothetical protein